MATALCAPFKCLQSCVAQAKIINAFLSDRMAEVLTTAGRPDRELELLATAAGSSTASSPAACQVACCGFRAAVPQSRMGIFGTLGRALQSFCTGRPGSPPVRASSFRTLRRALLGSHRFRRFSVPPRMRLRASRRQHALGGWRVLPPAKVMWCYSEFHFVLDTSPRYMSGSQVERAVACGTSFLVGYQRLAELALADGRALFRLRPKLHEAAHIPLWLESTGFNVRYLACWSDEDFLGRICALAKMTNVHLP